MREGEFQRRSPGSISVKPESGMLCRPSVTKISVSEERPSRGSISTKYLTVRVGTPEKRTKLTGTRDGVDERDRVITGELEVEDVGCWSVVMDERRKAVGVVGGQRKFTEDRPRRMAWQAGVCGLFETHPAFASQEKRVLHITAPNDACVYCECSGGGVAMQELDAKPNRRRGEKGSRLPKTSPRTRRRMSFADVRSSVALFHASPGFSGDEGLGGAGVQEGYVAVAAGDGGSASKFNPGGE